MSTNTFDIQEGMEVFASDGQKIGKVGEVINRGGVATESGASAASTVDESSSYSSDTSDTGDFGAADNLTLNRDASGSAGGTGYDVTRDSTELREEYGNLATETRPAGTSGYFTVSEGGIFGLGAKELFVPFTAVETVAADGVVTLTYPKDEVNSRFDHKPDETDDTNSPDMPTV